MSGRCLDLDRLEEILVLVSCAGKDDDLVLQTLTGFGGFVDGLMSRCWSVVAGININVQGYSMGRHSPPLETIATVRTRLC